MIGLTGALLVASLALLPQAAAGPTGSRLSLLDVPYLSQSELLCGGAAAAMVLRYWGAADIGAEAFAPLVDRSRGGIDARALARAVEERGYETHAASGTAALVEREMAAGRPVIALIEDRPGTFHYVVIVGWHARAVVLHDPARTPYVLMQPAEFARRWKASDFWMLAIAPRPGSGSESGFGVGVRSPGSESQFGVGVRSPGSESQFGVGVQSPGSEPQFGVGVRSPGSEPQFGVGVQSPGSEPQFGVAVRSNCDTLVADGIGRAQQNDLPGAERLLTEAAYQCDGAPPLRELAGVRLLQRRWGEVQDLSSRAVEIDPGDAHAWRLLATARYIGGDHAGALDAWNRAGEPRLDLISVSGLGRTTHRSVESLIGLESGAVLTRADAGRARRMLDELPAAALTRLEYVPRGAGRAEVRAHVVERSLWPRGRLTWAAMGLRAAASREVGVALASLGRGGERLDVTWRFWPDRPAVGAALHVPSRAGIVSLDIFSERQPFDVVTLPDAERLTTRGRLGSWATPFLRWEGRSGLARWQDRGSFGTAGGAVRLQSGRAVLQADADAWLGGDRFAAMRVSGGWRSSDTRRGAVFDLSSGVHAVTADAPLDLWPAGDTGHAREPLLRAHPLLDEGRLRVDRLGRRLTHVTAEAQRWWTIRGAVPVGAAVFVDAARVFLPPAVAARNGAATGDVDAGAGFRLALPGRRGSFRIDYAHGLRDGRNAVSVGWTPD